ncbi:MAG: hypothetical protein GY787_26230 [Alteromonadales bacterium]|nr:hypothetical protein [Alteromonadales bacterium]
MPNRIIGLIGIDTLENIEYPLTREEFKNMSVPLEMNYQSASRQFVDDITPY